jgi:acetyl-CoA acetyltransferase
VGGLKHLSGKAVIAGYGDAYSPRDNPVSPMTLAVDAALRCMKDAGVSRDDIDGILTTREPFGDYRPQWNNVFASHMQIAPRYSTQVMIHAVGANSMLKHAMIAVTSGAADYVLCVVTDGGKAFMDPAAMSSVLELDTQFELPYGAWMPALYAMVCRRYMHDYGVTVEDVATASVVHQEWGRRHPEAEKYSKGPITVDDVLSSREIASPLTLWMCSIWRRAGTAGAFLVTTAERAADLDCTPIYILGSSEYVISDSYMDKMSFRGVHPLLGQQPTLTTTSTMAAARQAYEMASVSAADMQIAQTNSNFAHQSMIMLEDLGFCGKGEAAGFIADGHTSPGGSLAYNTNGGMLSFGQGGVSCIMDGEIELVRQLRGEALGLQVNCDIGLAQALSPASSSVTILSSRR